MASIGNGKPDAEGQERQPERQAARLLQPADVDVPPPHTEAGRVVLLDVLRRRVDGFPTWMLPRYLVHGVDVYGFHPVDLLRRHPPATSPDGKRASYFVNLVRPLTATDARRSRVVPGGFWKSERAPVPVEAAPDKMVGTKQAFSFISKEAEDEGGPRGGFIMHELLLPGQAGRLAGGDELALSKVYPSPRAAAKKRSQGQGPTASATRTAAASSAPALQRRLQQRKKQQRRLLSASFPGGACLLCSAFPGGLVSRPARAGILCAGAGILGTPGILFSAPHPGAIIVSDVSPAPAGCRQEGALPGGGQLPAEGRPQLFVPPGVSRHGGSPFREARADRLR